jgi:hypothetical protein
VARRAKGDHMDERDQSPARTRDRVRTSPLRAASLPVEELPAPLSDAPSPWLAVRLHAVWCIGSLVFGVVQHRPMFFAWAMVWVVLGAGAFWRASRAPLSTPIERGPGVLAAVAGSCPGSFSLTKAADVLGGAAGQRATARAGRRSGAPGVGPRRIELTATEVRQLDLGVVTASSPLSEVRTVASKRAFANTYRRVLTVATAGGDLRLEGDGAEVASLASAIQASGGLDSRSVTGPPSFWLARAFVVGLLVAFGGAAVLIAIAELSEEGASVAATTAAIGAVLIAAGFGAKRVLLR